jgi:hypothetical protein
MLYAVGHLASLIVYRSKWFRNEGGDMKSIVILLVLSAFAALCVSDLPATPQSEDLLQKQAKLTVVQAEKIAGSKVENAKLKYVEIKKQHETVVWSFDFTKPNTKNLDEVQVDANTGTIVSSTTLTPAQQSSLATSPKSAVFKSSTRSLSRKCCIRYDDCCNHRAVCCPGGS